MSDETHELRRGAKAGNIRKRNDLIGSLPHKRKPVKAIVMTRGKEKRRFACAEDASRELGIWVGSIRRSARIGSTVCDWKARYV